jgi:hypothetical protein
VFSNRDRLPYTLLVGESFEKGQRRSIHRATGFQGVAAGTSVSTPGGVKIVEELVVGESVLSGVGDGLARFYEINEIQAIPYRGPMLRFEARADDENEFREFEFRVTPENICFATLTQDQIGTQELEPVSGIAIHAFQHFDLKSGTMTHTVYSQDRETKFHDLDSADNWGREIPQSSDGAEISWFFFHGDNYMDDAFYRFRPAIELQIGMLLITAREFTLQYAFITNIAVEPYDGLVYVLDIPKVRNFAANGVLVHDSTFLK